MVGGKLEELEAREIHSEDLKERVAGEVRTLEDWYSAEFERRLAELTKVLNGQLEARVEELRAQYQQQYELLQQKANQPHAQSQAPSPSSSPSESGFTSQELLEELARSEANAKKLASDLERMVADDNIPMGKLLQLRSQELELKAYIRGLKFCIEVGEATSSVAKPA